jgi:putative hydroxymethylpyrimidine transporter CytX
MNDAIASQWDRDAGDTAIRPIPQNERRLTGIDLAVLWGDFGVGLLVLAAGALLVPGLSASDAIVATVVGSVIGCALLALAAYIAADAGVPTMVLTRAALGLRGSALPTVLNVVQLLGWTSFELLVMAQFADRIAQHVGTPSLYPVWVLVLATFCTAMALGGPLVVVRQWLEKFGLWAMLLTTIALFALLASRYDVREILSRSGDGSLGFWLAVDIVVSMPLSWFPLVADYNRFARTRSGSFWGTFAGYFIANVTFFALGILATVALSTDPAGLSGSIVDLLLSGTGVAAWLLGLVAVLVILADETDNGFADIYSAAVSTQNVASRIPQPVLVVVAGAVGAGLALVLRNADYEGFLLLIGSVFTPLLGVVAADYLVVRRRRYDPAELFAPRGRYWYAGGVNALAILVWVVGFLVYEWISGGLGGLGLTWPADLAVGATIPSFVVAFAGYAVSGRLAVSRRGSRTAKTS